MALAPHLPSHKPPVSAAVHPHPTFITTRDSTRRAAPEPSRAPVDDMMMWWDGHHEEAMFGGVSNGEQTSAVGNRTPSTINDIEDRQSEERRRIRDEREQEEDAFGPHCAVKMGHMVGSLGGMFIGFMIGCALDLSFEGRKFMGRLFGSLGGFIVGGMVSGLIICGRTDSETPNRHPQHCVQPDPPQNSKQLAKRPVMRELVRPADGQPLLLAHVLANEAYAAQGGRQANQSSAKDAVTTTPANATVDNRDAPSWVPLWEAKATEFDCRAKSQKVAPHRRNEFSVRAAHIRSILFKYYQLRQVLQQCKTYAMDTSLAEVERTKWETSAAETEAKICKLTEQIMDPMVDEKLKERNLA